MAAYVVSELTSVNPERIAAYLECARAAIAAHGGRYLTSSSSIDLLEGSDAPVRIVIIEFESVEAARGWYDSPEYALALQERDDALVRRLMIVDGNIEN